VEDPSVDDDTDVSKRQFVREGVRVSVAGLLVETDLARIEHSDGALAPEPVIPSRRGAERIRRGHGSPVELRGSSENPARSGSLTQPGIVEQWNFPIGVDD